MPDVRGCPDESLLLLLAAGGLPASEAAELDAHLQSCADCGAAYERLFEPVIKALKQTPLDRPPAADVELAQELIAELKDLVRRDAESTLTPPRGLALTEDGVPLAEIFAPPQTAGEIGRLGPYSVLQVLGQGGMGTVYEGVDPVLNRSVALKVIRAGHVRAEERARFRREAQAVAALDHEHIVPIWHVGEEQGYPYLVMPLLRGESLAARLKREPRLPLALVLRIGCQVAQGLAVAHAAGLVHRDIKPANIWLEARPEGERVRILDFGLAAAESAGAARLTLTGTLLGTPEYMAPEQPRGDKVDARADLFSLGCVLYELTTGRSPFYAGSALAIIAAAESLQPPLPCKVEPALPQMVSELVMRLLAKRPEERPAAATEVVAAFQALERDTAQASPRTESHARRLPWRTFLLGALAAVALAAILVPLFAPQERTGPTSPTVELPPAEGVRGVPAVTGSGIRRQVTDGQGEVWTLSIDGELSKRGQEAGIEPVLGSVLDIGVDAAGVLITLEQKGRLSFWPAGTRSLQASMVRQFAIDSRGVVWILLGDGLLRTWTADRVWQDLGQFWALVQSQGSDGCLYVYAQLADGRVSCLSAGEPSMLTGKDVRAVVQGTGPDGKPRAYFQFVTGMVALLDKDGFHELGQCRTLVQGTALNGQPYAYAQHLDGRLSCLSAANVLTLTPTNVKAVVQGMDLDGQPYAYFQFTNDMVSRLDADRYREYAKFRALVQVDSLNGQPNAYGQHLDGRLSCLSAGDLLTLTGTDVKAVVQATGLDGHLYAYYQFTSGMVVRLGKDGYRDLGQCRTLVQGAARNGQPYAYILHMDGRLSCAGKVLGTDVKAAVQGTGLDGHLYAYFQFTSGMVARLDKDGYQELGRCRTLVQGTARNGRPNAYAQHVDGRLSYLSADKVLTLTRTDVKAVVQGRGQDGQPYAYFQLANDMVARLDEDSYQEFGQFLTLVQGASLNGEPYAYGQQLDGRLSCLTAVHVLPLTGTDVKAVVQATGLDGHLYAYFQFALNCLSAGKVLTLTSTEVKAVVQRAGLASQPYAYFQFTNGTVARLEKDGYLELGR